MMAFPFFTNTVTKDRAYLMGLDCGKNGPNEVNCHFSLFATPELTQEWERGKRNGDAAAPGSKADGS
jgi:hypothetical protein